MINATAQFLLRQDSERGGISAVREFLHNSGLLARAVVNKALGRDPVTRTDAQLKQNCSFNEAVERVERAIGRAHLAPPPHDQKIANKIFEFALNRDNAPEGEVLFRMVSKLPPHTSVASLLSFVTGREAAHGVFSGHQLGKEYQDLACETLCALIPTLGLHHLNIIKNALMKVSQGSFMLQPADPTRNEAAVRILGVLSSFHPSGEAIGQFLGTLILDDSLPEAMRITALCSCGNRGIDSAVSILARQGRGSDYVTKVARIIDVDAEVTPSN